MYRVCLLVGIVLDSPFVTIKKLILLHYKYYYPPPLQMTPNSIPISTEVIHHSTSLHYTLLLELFPTIILNNSIIIKNFNS